MSKWTLAIRLLSLGLLLVLDSTYSTELDTVQADMSSSQQDGKHLQVTQCSGPGCPYMGAWLAHSDLFMKAAWNLASRKMEEATFNMFRGNYVFQTGMEHHVKHMSMFEHSVRKADVENAAEIISKYVNAAYDGECDELRSYPVASDEYMVLIPFYGGLPPSVSKTIEDGIPTNGEGHSKMTPLLKAYSTMATVCSCLKYFGRIVVGVTSDSDSNLISNEVVKYAFII